MAVRARPFKTDTHGTGIRSQHLEWTKKTARARVCWLCISRYKALAPRHIYTPTAVYSEISGTSTYSARIRFRDWLVPSFQRTRLADREINHREITDEARIHRHAGTVKKKMRTTCYENSELNFKEINGITIFTLERCTRMWPADQNPPVRCTAPRKNILQLPGDSSVASD
jgi:hypothetical protein